MKIGTPTVEPLLINECEKLIIQYRVSLLKSVWQEAPFYLVDNSEVRQYLKSYGCLALIPEPFAITEFENLQTSSRHPINGKNNLDN